jgi:hypothetical protein
LNIHSHYRILGRSRALTSREDLIDAPGISSATKINWGARLLVLSVATHHARELSAWGQHDDRRFVHGQESFNQRRATQERYPFLAQGAQQLDPAGIRKRQTLQIETYSGGGLSRRNDLSYLLDPCTE